MSNRSRTCPEEGLYGVIAQRLERPPVSRNVWGSNPHNLVSINQTTMNTTMKLTGDTLVDYVNERMELINRGELTRTQMILDSGYVYDNGKPMYTEFYTELLRSRGVVPVTNTDVEDDEYENLSGLEKDLYDSITDLLGEKWTHEETIEFMNELEDIGITTPEDFQESYEYTSDEYHANKDFAEYFVMEVLDARIPDIVLGSVDWDDVWESNLRYDYNVIETNNGSFFFRNN
jgi:hypothetical protein